MVLFGAGSSGRGGVAYDSGIKSRRCWPVAIPVASPYGVPGPTVVALACLTLRLVPRQMVVPDDDLASVNSRDVATRAAREGPPSSCSSRFGDAARAYN
jgi:hypothetical protein